MMFSTTPLPKATLFLLLGLLQTAKPVVCAPASPHDNQAPAMLEFSPFGAALRNNGFTVLQNVDDLGGSKRLFKRQESSESSSVPDVSELEALPTTHLVKRQAAQRGGRQRAGAGRSRSAPARVENGQGPVGSGIQTSQQPPSILDSQDQGSDGFVNIPDDETQAPEEIQRTAQQPRNYFIPGDQGSNGLVDIRDDETQAPEEIQRTAQQPRNILIPGDQGSNGAVTIPDEQPNTSGTVFTAQSPPSILEGGPEGSDGFVDLNEGQAPAFDGPVTYQSPPSILDGGPQGSDGFVDLNQPTLEELAETPAAQTIEAVVPDPNVISQILRYADLLKDLLSIPNIQAVFDEVPRYLARLAAQKQNDPLNAPDIPPNPRIESAAPGVLQGLERLVTESDPTAVGNLANLPGLVKIVNEEPQALEELIDQVPTENDGIQYEQNVGFGDPSLSKVFPLPESTVRGSDGGAFGSTPGVNTPFQQGWNGPSDPNVGNEPFQQQQEEEQDDSIYAEATNPGETFSLRREPPQDASPFQTNQGFPGASDQGNQNFQQNQGFEQNQAFPPNGVAAQGQEGGPVYETNKPFGENQPQDLNESGSEPRYETNRQFGEDNKFAENGDNAGLEQIFDINPNDSTDVSFGPENPEAGGGEGGWGFNSGSFENLPENLVVNDPDNEDSEWEYRCIRVRKGSNPSGVQFPSNNPFEFSSVPFGEEAPTFGTSQPAAKLKKRASSPELQTVINEAAADGEDLVSASQEGYTVLKNMNSDPDAEGIELLWPDTNSWIGSALDTDDDGNLDHAEIENQKGVKFVFNNPQGVVSWDQAQGADSPGDIIGAALENPLTTVNLVGGRRQSNAATT